MIRATVIPVFGLALLLSAALKPAESIDRVVKLWVSDVEGTELEGASLELCRQPLDATEGTEAECEWRVAKKGGLEWRLLLSHKHTATAHLDGFLSTSIGPIVVQDWRYPVSALQLVLNAEVME